MSGLVRPKRATLAHAVAAPSETHGEMWVACAALAFLAVIIGGGLVVLSVEYRGGWAADHQVAMDKADAIHKLLFRE
jgi:hypothetical protein